MKNLLLAALLGLLYPCASFACDFAFINSCSLSHNSFTDTLCSYPPGFHKAGDNSMLTPTIKAPGGVFSYQRLSGGQGAIKLDTLTGIISLRSSDPGAYKITYKLQERSESITVKLIQ
jgi:hypothetical protein